MTYNEWVSQANLTDFKNRVKTGLNNLSFNNPILSQDTFLTTVLNAVKARYGLRRIWWQNASDFEDNLWLELMFEIPEFASRIKKYSFFNLLHDETSFGTSNTLTENVNFQHTGKDTKLVNDTDNTEHTSKLVKNSTDGFESTKTSNSTSESTDTTRNEHTGKDTTTNTKTSTSNSSGTDSTTTLDGGVPNMSSNGDTLDTSILAYDKNVSKVSRSSNESGEESGNTTVNSTSTDTSNGTHNTTDRDNITDNSTRTINGTDTNTGSDNRTRTSNSTINETDTDTTSRTNNSTSVDKQEGVLNILKAQGEWQFEFNQLIKALDHLFIGVSYYEY